ncbi:DUF3613 domain-containing protein [Thioalkalivibrio sp. ALJT]|uniref:DUF3613 domain-containing protein n=1 Tax=Thioalkalivibrio sp. ALJT TaxID=1158146 RepID=UPI00037476D2|nr:DUF3613 domain-containing protein [Thioalkalivibrio sp. ALJT]
MKALKKFSMVSGTLFIVLGLVGPVTFADDSWTGPVADKGWTAPEAAEKAEEMPGAHPVAESAESAPVARAGVDRSESVGTRDWLAMQRDGAQASEHVQGLSEAARTRALGRYLDSFTHPIPEHYIDRGSFSVD